MPGRTSAALPTPRLILSPLLVPRWLPDSINGGLVGVGDQLECGVGSGQWEHAGVQGLLGEGVVGRIKFAWHHIHGHGGLEDKGQGELAGPEEAPTSPLALPLPLAHPIVASIVLPAPSHSH